MKALRLLLCALAAALTVVGGTQAAGANGGEGCRNVHAVGLGQDVGGGNTTATITHGGVLNGTTAGHFDISGSPPAFTITGTVVFTTKHGTLSVSLVGSFDVTSGAFNATGPITGGTGKLAGTTGTLAFAGVENLATGVFTETITGTVCRANEGDDD